MSKDSQKDRKKSKNRIIDILLYGIVIIGIGILAFSIFDSRVIEKSETNKAIEAFRSSEKAKENKSQVSVFDEENKPIGVISIPKIDIALPIYDRLSERALSKGVGAMNGFDDLSGKEGTLCVLSSHSGLSASGLFTNLDKLRKKDHFYIENKDKVINKYLVDSLHIVKPNNTKLLKAEQGKGKAILITCISEEGINSHRLLVVGHFVGTVDHIEKGRLTLSTYEKILLCVVFCLLVLIIFERMRRRKKRRRANEKK